jgi:hypothetical protein
MEEIIELKTLAHHLQAATSSSSDNEMENAQLKQSHRKSILQIQQMWSDRLLGCPKTEEIWTRFANLRGLFFSTMEYFEFFYEYCEICIKHGKLVKCEKIIDEFKKEIEGNKDKYQDRLEMIEVLDIQVNFAQELIKNEDQIDMIVKFLANSTTLPAFKKSQLLFECANVLLAEPDLRWKKKIIGLLQESTKIYVSEKQLELLGSMHLTVS